MNPTRPPVPRRRCLRTLLAGAVWVALLPMAAHADTYPSKPIKYIVPFSPGGVSDAVARLLSQKLSERLGQNVLVENKPGVSGIVGTQAAARSPADGYTVIGGTITTHAVNAFFNKNLGYEQVKDFAPVSLVGTVSNVLVVPANSPFNSVQDIIAALKAQPDALTYGTAGAGTSQHLAGQLFQSQTGTRMRQIPYKGGAGALTDLIGGQLDMVFETVAAARPMIDAKRVKALAVTSKARVDSLPGVPALSELGLPGYEMQSWQGVFAPAGTPPAVVERLSRELAAIVREPDVQATMRKLGVEPVGSTAPVFAAFQRSEIEKWEKVIRESGIKAE